MANSQLFTIGYEGAELSDFLVTLSQLKIRQVIDVRELPLSRKRGFSKRSLSTALEHEGIRYVHLRELGDPKAGREAARRGNFVEFRKIYRQHLRGVAAQEAIKVAAAIASKARTCLLCFEREPENCHRSIVASCLAADWTFDINHVGVCVKVGSRKNLFVDDRDKTRAYAIG